MIYVLKTPGSRVPFPGLLAVMMLSLPASPRSQTYHTAQTSVNLVNGCARLTPDLFSSAVNPAVLAATRGIRLAASSEDAWSLPEFSLSRLMAVTPAGNGALALGLQQSGNNDFRESGFDLGYGLPIGKGGVGLLLHYQQFRARGYAPVSAAAAAFGLRLQLFPRLLTGMSFTIPFSPFGKPGPADKPSGDYRIELGYLASEQVSFFAAWMGSSGLPAAAEVGIDYAFAARFFFIAGLHGRTGAPFGKCGWAKNGWRISLFTAYQAPLGFSPGLAFSWDRPDAAGEKKKKEGAR